MEKYFTPLLGLFVNVAKVAAMLEDCVEHVEQVLTYAKAAG